jgi:hypothetical protein
MTQGREFGHTPGGGALKLNRLGSLAAGFSLLFRYFQSETGSFGLFRPTTSKEEGVSQNRPKFLHKHAIL